MVAASERGDVGIVVSRRADEASSSVLKDVIDGHSFSPLIAATCKIVSTEVAKLVARCGVVTQLFFHYLSVEGNKDRGLVISREVIS